MAARKVTTWQTPWTGSSSAPAATRMSRYFCMNSTGVSGIWLLLRRRQVAHADLFEPDDVAGVVILEADVAPGRAFGLALGLVPGFARGQVLGGRVKFGHALAVDVDQDGLALERDDHGPPAVGHLLGEFGGL